MSKRRLTGRVIKGVGGVYTVSVQGEHLKCFARGKLRRDGEIYIGDIVDIVYDKEGIIEKVHTRKSCLVRPYVSNMDILLIVVAATPSPDMLLLDKLIIGADSQDIRCIVAVNKCDQDGSVQLADMLSKDYSGVADIIKISAHTGYGIDTLLEEIRGSYVCMAGQSAVGKSSLINAIIGDDVSETGDISLKSARGRHTTRHVKIYELDGGIEIADTCGFSMLEMPITNPALLKSYYPDFHPYARDCKYVNCNHVAEEECGVRRAAEQNLISKSRYDRYLTLYNDNFKRWNSRYD
ncbi:MAG: ribosome small subunit-dependent GTPase A [Clostridia bacterium]|nr:ribosome small subunit-dependent GTPase A [Clostridia bacterium]